MNKTILTLLSIGLAGTLNAQNLPSTQKSAVNLSGPVKADGVFDEIKGKLQAYNKSTNVYYTIANNGQNLYLAIQVSDKLTFKKIIGGGVSFTTCNSGSRGQVNPVVITYPLIAENFRSPICNLFSNMLMEKDVTTRDQLLAELNKRLSAAQKEIGIKGIKEIEDKEISVYNETGIKANTIVNKDGQMCFELILPLKLLGLDKPHQTIAYNIMLNGMTLNQVVRPAKNGEVAVVTSIPHGMVGENDDYRELEYPTDFWAKYTLY